MTRRNFFKDILNHCYQRSADGGVLFYSYSDHLVYFTIYCQMARRYNIRVVSLCQMPDHVHDVVTSVRLRDLESFKRDTNSLFAKRYNLEWGCHDAVFEHSFGSAPKRGAKNGRSVLIYVGNNPPERQLTSCAEDYRWGYLAYALSDHPFSEKLVIRRSSAALVKAVKQVRAQFLSGLPLTHALLKRLFTPLNSTECQQLTDYIICTYNVIDYSKAVSFFDGSFQNMLDAMHVNTGKEHDLNEVFVGKNDKAYIRMTKILQAEYGLKDVHDLLAMTYSQKQELFSFLRERTDVMAAQIGKFLHLPINFV